MEIVAGNSISYAIAAEESGVSYSSHIQSIGWQNSVSNGQTSGTTGQSKRMEAIKISLTNPEYSGSIQYRSHVQSYGWMTGLQTEKLVGQKARRNV